MRLIAIIFLIFLREELIVEVGGGGGGGGGGIRGGSTMIQMRVSMKGRRRGSRNPVRMVGWAFTLIVVGRDRMIISITTTIDTPTTGGSSRSTTVTVD